LPATFGTRILCSAIPAATRDGLVGSGLSAADDPLQHGQLALHGTSDGLDV
jgi:hypothetical protein